MWSKRGTRGEGEGAEDEWQEGYEGKRAGCLQGRGEVCTTGGLGIRMAAKDAGPMALSLWYILNSRDMCLNIIHYLMS